MESFRKQVAAGPGLEDFLDESVPSEIDPDATAAAAAAAAGEPPRRRRYAGKFSKRREPLPKWLRLSSATNTEGNENYARLRKSMRENKLSTVCEEARCPNRAECWGGDGGMESATATIMLMGDTCTRGCRFCAVKTAVKPAALDVNEPENAAEAIKKMGVGYVVLTMVDRDDLPDGGAAHVAKCITEIKSRTAGSVMVECLAGDFRGNHDLVAVVAGSGLEVYAHNIECVERLTPQVRDRRATYRQSLGVLRAAKERTGVLTKSSIMLGFGESQDEVRQTLVDLREAGVDCVTLGQYLQPLNTRMKVARYVPPEEFDQWKEEGEKMGFAYVASGPMVRSSYRAGEFYISNILKKRAQGAADA
eukprot:TRINITY_DN9778_c2_g1_i1.p1 TRINITY_DN9778_c2_g1~~TRINITY_DN9778_c2_g1_i1.p1  ORF type:complete len:420 (+),score=126.92 TRINITY_DN9778_c2_g1_i1:174-1262(+)